MRTIYFDYNATTPLDSNVRAAMLPYLEGIYGNPSSIHQIGRKARSALDDARERVAAVWRCKPSEIVFTSGGTESSNMAIFGAARALRDKGRHLITSSIEHHSVLHCFQSLEKMEGFEVTYLPASAEGIVSPGDLEKAIRPGTTLVSVMGANNEVGSVQDVAAFGRICRERGIIFHTDAVQCFGKEYDSPVCGQGTPPHESGLKKEPPLPSPLLHKCVEEREMAQSARIHGFDARKLSGKSLSGSLPAARGEREEQGNIGQADRRGRGAFENIEQFNADLVSFCAHKLHGPKGAGALYIKSPFQLHPLILGGSHENERRAGTENLASIIGLVETMERFVREPVFRGDALFPLTERLWTFLEQLDGVQVCGSRSSRLCNTVACTVSGADSIALLAGLDLEGICASSGSACSAGSLEPSHVLTAMGVDAKLANSLVRFSLGRESTGEELGAAQGAFENVIKRIRGR